MLVALFCQNMMPTTELLTCCRSYGDYAIACGVTHADCCMLAVHDGNHTVYVCMDLITGHKHTPTITAWGAHVYTGWCWGRRHVMGMHRMVGR